uniref:Intraflagellar transport protein 43 homolog n=1 Tax=Globodera pallida TaxID=36090 RepID=A0A183CFB7_GLOPA
MGVGHQLLVNSPSKKRIYGTAPEEKKLQPEEKAKPEKMAKVSSEVSARARSCVHLGSMDPKSQLEELLEMNEVLMWEMAVRSEEEQITMSVRPEDLLITDLEDEPITDLEDEPITDLEVEQIIEEIQLEDELIADLEDDTEDDDLLQWFPTFIFMKLEKFLPNVPQGDGQHKAELIKLVESWKAEKQSIDIEHETVHVKEIENSLDTYREELRER